MPKAESLLDDEMLRVFQTCGRAYAAAKKGKQQRLCALYELDRLIEIAETLGLGRTSLAPLIDLSLAIAEIDRGNRHPLLQRQASAVGAKLPIADLLRRVRAAWAMDYYIKAGLTHTAAADTVAKVAKARPEVNSNNVGRWRDTFRRGDPSEDLGAALYHEPPFIPVPGQSLMDVADYLAKSLK